MNRSDKAGETVAGIVIITIIVAVLLGPWLLAPYYWFYVDAGPTVQARLPAPPECYVPPGVMADGAAAANVEAWEDSDGDQQRDAGETPLPDVVVSMRLSNYNYSADDGVAARRLATDIKYIQVMGPTAQLTDQNGRASLRDFRAGCACRCWGDAAVAAWPPDGYELTTPRLVDLTSNVDTVGFGFRKKGP